MSLNNKPRVTWPNLIYLHPVELHYYPFIPNKCSGSCNSVEDLSTKIYVLSKTKDINVNVFNMITSINEAKTMMKHAPYDCKCKVNSTTCNSNQKLNNDK